MGSRMKVLGVAPYEGMQSLMYKVAEEFPDIELSVFLGDLAAGVAVVQERMQETMTSSSPAAARLVFCASRFPFRW